MRAMMSASIAAFRYAARTVVPSVDSCCAVMPDRYAIGVPLCYVPLRVFVVAIAFIV